MQEKTSINLRKPREREGLVTGDTILNEKYALTQMIGKGSFGQVFRGVYTDKDKSKRKYPKNVAIKVENDLDNVSQISNQITLLNALQEKGMNKDCFPKLFASGVENGKMFMVMDLLGPSLYNLMQVCGGKFSLRTSILLTLQIIDRIQTLHQIGYVFRDIKPENFLMGLGKQSKRVFLVDFGLCKRYRDQTTKILVPYKQATSMAGTIRYSSLNSHLGINQTRRDDLQSICYLLIFFLKGELPWQKIGTQHKFQKDYMISNMKLKLTTAELCEGLPQEIHNILEYVKQLGFYDDPDYRFIQAQLSFIIKNKCKGTSMAYDWECFQKKEVLEINNLTLLFPDLNDDENSQSIIDEKSPEKNMIQI